MDPHFDGVIFQTHAAELRRRIRYDFPAFRLLDVRPADEHAAGHIPGAISISIDALGRGLPAGGGPSTEYFVVGTGPGDPAVRAASLALLDHGAYRIVELAGGMVAWEEADGELAGGATDRAA